MGETEGYIDVEGGRAWYRAVGEGGVRAALGRERLHLFGSSWGWPGSRLSR